MAEDFASVLARCKVIPVAQFDDPVAAIRTAEILLKHGFGILEITLRTDAAFDCILAVCREIPGMLVGAGSVLSVESMDRACDAGARFGVSPGFDETVVERAVSCGIPFIPGAATPTELARALRQTAIVKIFPASLLGGPEYIKAIVAPFRMMDFYLVPTGGINADNYLAYLKQERVVAVGMSYPVESSLIQKSDFAAVEERVKSIAASLQ